MSRALGASVPVVAFGDPGQSTWGVIIGGASPRLAVGELGTPSNGGATTFEPVTIEVGEPAGEWTTTAGGGSLHVSADAEAEADGDAETDAGARRLARCEVSGALAGRAFERRLEAAPGVRADALPSRKIGSIRLVAAWFEAGHGVGLVACRPAGAGGQDRDELTVVTSGEADGVSVFDPRLSTTYGADGAPRQMGIELWLGESEDSDHYPRRVAGTTAGRPATTLLDGIRVDAVPLHCLSRGDEGVGVYLLLTAT
jgi:hypothetical protein